MTEGMFGIGDWGRLMDFPAMFWKGQVGEALGIERRFDASWVENPGYNFAALQLSSRKYVAYCCRVTREVANSVMSF